MGESATEGIRGVVELGGRTLLRFSGSDRVRYLNGQITNDVRKASADRVIYACVTDAKGKLEADIYVRGWGEDGLLIDSVGGLREALGMRLERYIIADDVEMEDLSDEYVIFHVLGKDMSGGVGKAGEWIGKADRYGADGFDVVAPAASVEEVRGQLGAEVDFLSETDLEAFRISRRVPVWGKELEPGLLPPEARLEGRAIDYEKGCYIGQEVISRIRSAGRVNRLLCLFRGMDGEFSEGQLVFAKGEDGRVKEVGRLTSVAEIGGERLALGFVKRGFTDVGMRFSCGNSENSLFSTVEIGEIPDPSPC